MSRYYLLHKQVTLLTIYSKSKLPIYPIQEPEIVLQETPSELERQIGSVRRSVTATYLDTYGRVQELVSRWIGVERSVERA